MAHQDAACAALVVMSSVTEESSSTDVLLSTERHSGLAPTNVDQVGDDHVDVGPTDVTDYSILAGLGLIDVYGRLSRDAYPVDDRGVSGASAGEPGILNFGPNGGSVQTEFKLVGGFCGQELAASLAKPSGMFSTPESQRLPVARELVMGSQPSEYLARSGVAGGSVFGQVGEYSGYPLVCMQIKVLIHL